MAEEEDVEFQIWIWGIPRFILLILIILAVILLIRFFVISKIDTFETESNVIINRILYSPTGIIYHDEDINRYYPGIIDVTKFKTEILENTLLMPNNQYFAVKLHLEGLKDDFVEETYVNKVWYDNWLPREGYPGPGGTQLYRKDVYVLYKEEDSIKPGMLKVSVIMPNQ